MLRKITEIGLKMSLLLLLGMQVMEVMAVKAYPGLVERKLPDGSKIMVRIHGDEYFGYLTTSDGYIIAEGADGFYYYADYAANGEYRISNIRASNPGLRTVQERMGLVMRSKEMIYPFKARIARQAARLREQEVRTSFPVRGHIKTLVILAEFQDVKFSVANPRQTFTDLTNQSGYSGYGADGSVRDYYLDNSGGLFDPEFIVAGPVTLSKEMEYYGREISPSQHDANVTEMVAEACRLAKQQGLDFTQFDLDGDGILDNIFIYYAGYNQAESGIASTIWPHRSTVITENVIVDGLRLAGYACSSELKGNVGTEEMAGIGTCCHEFAHVLGLMDVYDTNYGQEGLTEELNSLSLMAAGNYNNGGRTPAALTALEKQMIGWMEPEMLIHSGEYVLPPVAENKAYYLETDNEGEIFILENRDKSYKWDRYIEGDGGMLLYQVDRSQNPVNGIKAADRWQQNTLNCVGGHPCLRLVSANGNSGDADRFFPGDQGVTSWEVVPWSGANLEKRLEEITFEGQNIHFTYQHTDLVSLSGVVTDMSGQPVEGVLLTFTRLEEELTPVNERISVVRKLQKNADRTVRSDASGQYRLSGLAAGRYEIKTEKKGYAPSTLYKTLDVPVYTLDILILTLGDAGNVKLSWNNGTVDGFTETPGSMIYVSRWDEADLSAYTGWMLKWVDIHVYDAANVELQIYLDEKKVLAKSVPDFKPGQTNRIYLGEEAVVIPAGKQLRVGYRAIANADHPQVQATINYVNGNKGAEYSMDGSNWNTLPGESFLIDAWLTKPIPVTEVSLDQSRLTLGILDSIYLKPTILPEEATYSRLVWTSTVPQVATVNEKGGIVGLSEGKTVIIVSVMGGDAQASCEVEVKQDYVKEEEFVAGQREIRFGWKEKEETKHWKIKWKKHSDQNFRTLEVDTTFCILNQLQPDTEYDLQLVALAGESETGALITKTFRTKPVQGEFPVLARIRTDWEEGEAYWPVVDNIQGEVRKIVWKLDGEIFVATRDLILPSGKHVLRAEVTTADGITEIVIREIIVKSKKDKDV